MADQNPFSSYSTDEQNYIADQLRTARDSGKLNPAQMQGVGNALKYLPMSKQESSQYLTGLATMGQGTWQKPFEPSFQQANLPALSAQYAEENRPRLPGWANPKVMLHPGALVNQARHDVMSMGGDAAVMGTEKLLNAQRRDPTKPLDPDIMSVARATARFGGETIADPMTAAAFLLPGSKAVSGAFAAQGAVGTYQAASELHDVWDRQDIPRDRKIELGTNIALNAMMTGLAGSHSVKGLLDTTRLPLEDKLEVQQRIESEWQQQPNGQMIRKQATPAVTDNRVVNRNYQGGDLSRQFPEGSFQSRMIDKRGAIPVAAEPEAKFARTVEEAPASQTGVLSADEVKPVSGAAPDRVSTPEASAADTDFYAKAKAEWMEKNPGVSPDKGISWIARRSNELKTGVQDKTLQPTISFHENRWVDDLDPESGIDFAKTYEGYPAHSVFATVGDKRVGSIQLLGTKGAPDYLRVFASELDPEYRGKGFGMKMYQTAIENAKRLGYKGLESDTSTTADSARVWRKLGAEELPVEKGDTSSRFRLPFTISDKTPVSETVKELTPQEKAALLKPDRSGITDLRSVDDDTRHAWKHSKSMNIEFGVGKTAADAMREARAVFGPDRHLTINSFIDKDGTLKHGLQLFVDEKGEGVMHPSPANAEDVSRLSLKGQQLFEAVQAGEGKFNELTAGKHPKVLDSLWETTKRTLPDAPHEAKLSLYNKGLSALLDAARDAKSINDFQKAFDIVTKKSEGGFANPFGKQRISDADAKLMAKLHADTVMKRWESLPDAALNNRKVEKKLSDPALRNSVYGAGDPALESRYEALLDRSSKLRVSDPVAVLGHTLDGHSITSRDISAGALREGMGQAARSREMRQKALQSYRDEWKSRPISDTIRFLDAVENGDLQSITDPTDRAMAGKLRELLDTKRDQIRDLGREIMRTRVEQYDIQIIKAKSTDQAAMWQRERDYIQDHLDAGETSLLNKFYENYFPHMWRYGIKDMATNLMQGRRPFAPRNFLKQRTYSTFTEGIADGMEPVTYNPVDMVLLKLHEMDRFATAHKTFNAIKDMGLAHIFTPDQVPDGWTKVNDNMFNAGSQAAWYMPKDAALPLNRHLGPGLRGNVAYDVIANYNNLINQANLGLSAFHGVETGVNAIASRFGLGLTKLSRFAEFPQNLKGVKDIALSPLAPIMAPMEGRRVAAEYLDPGRYAQYEQTANALETANGRIKLPSEYSNQAVEAFRNAWKEAAFAQSKGMPGRALSKAALGTFRSVGALMEQVNKPIMEWQVPSTKLGVFHWMAQDILERLPADASPEVIRKEMGYAWDRVDDRFGQVVYDNLFWNRMGKDMAHLMVRSVGWNYGDIRELGGAVWDLRDKEALKAAATGKGISPKQGYVLGLLGVTAMMGYTLNHIYGQKIDNPIDMLYPKNGKLNPDGSPQRIYMKTYVHDAYQFAHAPGETGLNKMAPVWKEIGEMYKNADYYGTQIHPIHGTTGDALTDPQTYTGTGKYMLDQALPFSARNFEQRRAQGESIGSALSSTAAILPAPKWVGQSKAELLAFELFKTKLKQGPNDPVKDEAVRRYHELASGYAANRFTAKDVSDAFKNGQITAKQLDGILDEEEGKLSPLERHAKQLEPHELLRVWEVATPLEKKVLTDKFLHAWDSIDTKYTDKDRVSLNLDKRFLSDWQTFIKSKQSN